MASNVTQSVSKEQSLNAPNRNNNESDDRETWSGRVTFWLAAVGSAVGLGNLCRFPWQCDKWGAGAFIMAYFVALFTLGMPLLTQELALDEKHRSGDIEAFGQLNWRLREHRFVFIHSVTVSKSSHHGIHGHYNKNVVIENVHIKYLETHGVQMSYFENLKMKNMEIGPSSTVAYLSGEYGYVRCTVASLECIRDSEGMVHCDSFTPKWVWSTAVTIDWITDLFEGY